jgi:phenylalanyl-tRNA synthetase beta chain
VLIADVRLFDRYQPEGGELSLAIEVVLQPTERTLTEADLLALSDKVVASAAKLGARLRA